MDILKTAVAVLVDRQTEILFEAAVPFAGKVGCLEIAGHEGAFKLIAKQNMEIIGRFVSFDSDKRRRDIVNRAIELVQVNIFERFPEYPFCLGQKISLELFGAANLIFPHPRLRLMDTERDRFAHR